MPMRRVMFNQGLVTSKDAAFLGEGELSLATDAMYKPNDPAIWKVPGRSEFNQTAEVGTLIGVRFLQFDPAHGSDGGNLLVASVGTTLRTAPAAPVGTFATAESGLTAGSSSLDSAHYNNQHVLFDGVNLNRVVSSDGTVSLQGMLENTTAPTVSRDAGGGAGFILTTGLEIIYWVEERVKVGSDIIKRNAETGDTIVTLVGDGSTDKPVITRPAVMNSEATHWALYATSTSGVFPVGAEIAEVEIATTTIEDTRTGTDPAFPSGESYELLSVDIAGVTANVAKHGPVPISTTGDILEDSVVMNDMTNRSLVRYTVPDDIHSCPAINFIRFETKEADEVVLIRTMGQIQIIGLRDSIWRLETLPRPEDASFQIERVKALIHDNHGVVGPKAADLFSFGSGMRLAYVSVAGVMATDGYSWDVLSDDLKWNGEVSIAALHRAVLINNPVMYRLELYVPSEQSGFNNIAYYLHYHPSHTKQTSYGLRCKITGPIHVAAKDACRVSLSGDRIIFTANRNGKLYREGAGSTDQSGAGGIQFAVKTGDHYFNQVGGEARVKRWWVHHTAAHGRTATASLTMRNSEEDDVTVSESINISRREPTAAYHNGHAEAFQFGVANDDSDGQVGINGLFIEHDGLGASE